MFRGVTRIKQALPKEECIEMLKKELRGVLSMLGDDDYPYGIPINHYYNEEDGKLYFHGGDQGHKLDAIRRHNKVSFCIYDEGFRKEGEWALNIRSVVVFGHVEFVDDREKLDHIARKLSYKFTNDNRYIEHEIESAGPRTVMFALVPEHITGKLVNEA